MKNVLIICTGNICRSPIAAALLQKRLTHLGLASQVQVESAGTWALEGEPASGLAVSVLAQAGLSLEGHRARTVTEDMLDRADLVIVMAEEHRRSLFNLSMRNLNKVFLLSELSGNSDDVIDPIGGTRDQYRATAEHIDQRLKAGMPQILKQLHLQPSRRGRVGPVESRGPGSA